MNRKDKVAELVVHTSAIFISVVVAIITIVLIFDAVVLENIIIFLLALSLALFSISIICGIGYIEKPDKRKYSFLIVAYDLGFVLLIVFVIGSCFSFLIT